ncbi:hypothetical protein G7Z17_g1540 [Cylindrodendrum hubeiense]|uniref:PNPLA domain-containing protein n=1 Tax=Cylindrodendrum hubeiense TaxID=595255 RepID=A0A9P5HEQ7_9HYPO|nr:hypothetical protein G7Z17_g1540 [Cylindrodendrum hubeiense]
MSPLARHPNGVRLLSLDGGGIRGVAALVTLERIMARIQTRIGSKEICRPADYFELAGGTSTGGIIGVMLFRLRMTATDAIKEYKIISERVFSPKLAGYNVNNWYFGGGIGSLVSSTKTVFSGSRFQDGDLKAAIDRVVEKYGLDDNDRKLKGEAPLYHKDAGKTAETLLMRSYKHDTNYVSSKLNNIVKKHKDEITISLAARATSAAPTYFPEVHWLDGKDKTTFWDGGLLNNNPIDQLWYARYDLVEPEEPAPPVSCVISLGTGYESVDKLSTWSLLRLPGVATSVMDFATNTNAKGKDFSRHMTNLNRRPEHAKTLYVRFSPELKGVEIGLADYLKMDMLKDITTKELDKESSEVYVQKAVDALLP